MKLHMRFHAALVAWRNWRATVVRLLAPLILLILALAINEALKAKDRCEKHTSFQPLKTKIVGHSRPGHI